MTFLGHIVRGQELKKALERHPKYAHRANQEWRDAIERIHENLWPGRPGWRKKFESKKLLDMFPPKKSDTLWLN